MVMAALLSAACVWDNKKEGSVEIGDEIPAFEVTMDDGTVVNAKSLKGNPLVLCFFHTGCKDCREEFPVLQELYMEFAPRGVRFILIAREQGREEIEAYWKENGLTLPYSPQPDRKIYEKFASSIIPRVYLTDRASVVRFMHTDNPVATLPELAQEIKTLL